MAMNLIPTDIGKALDSYLDSLCQGNEGNADINVLELDGTILRYDITMQHKHRVKNPAYPLGPKYITVYSLTTYAKGTVDVKNPNPDDLKFCVDSPVGQICATLIDIVNMVALL